MPPHWSIVNIIEGIFFDQGRDHAPLRFICKPHISLIYDQKLFKAFIEFLLRAYFQPENFCAEG